MSRPQLCAQENELWAVETKPWRWLVIIGEDTTVPKVSTEWSEHGDTRKLQFEWEECWKWWSTTLFWYNPTCEETHIDDYHNPLLSQSTLTNYDLWQVIFQEGAVICFWHCSGDVQLVSETTRIAWSLVPCVSPLTRSERVSQPTPLSLEALVVGISTQSQDFYGICPDGWSELAFN